MTCHVLVSSVTSLQPVVAKLIFTDIDAYYREKSGLARCFSACCIGVMHTMLFAYRHASRHGFCNLFLAVVTDSIVNASIAAEEKKHSPLIKVH